MAGETQNVFLARYRIALYDFQLSRSGNPCLEKANSLLSKKKKPR